MPRENAKRGRRAEQKKRKSQDEDQDQDTNGPVVAKRQKFEKAEEPDFVPVETGELYHTAYVDQDAPLNGVGEMPFYGMLDEQEQEYFRRADQILELNQFDDEEARSLFLENVYKEASGKELKIVNSQSCSRLMERLIILSTPSQLKRLFQRFSDHFIHLIQHRFASHCCEALFVQAAPVVSQELLRPLKASERAEKFDEVSMPMEEFFLSTVKELEGNLGYLMTDKFASHALRLLLVVFSGEPLGGPVNKTLQSKRKENVGHTWANPASDLLLERRIVPDSFKSALEMVIANAVAGLDTGFLRSLAMHPTGNPTMQLLLKLELTQFGKERAKNESSIIRKLLPDEPLTESTGSASFINGLIYDVVGSRLLETIIEHAPGKTFKSLYKEFFRDRMETLARNEVAGYVVCKILERLSKEDLQAALELINTELPTLAERGRTVVIKTMVERTAARGVGGPSLADALTRAYRGTNGFDLLRLLRLTEQGLTERDDSSKRPDKLHASLLAQAMVAAPPPICTLVYEALLRLDTPTSVSIAKDPTASRLVQAAMIGPQADIVFRRKEILLFYGHIAELALDPVGSHFVDVIWKSTLGLAFIRERVAEELAEAEPSLRESLFGRAVWRNWKMDLYKHNRGEWEKRCRVKAGNDGFQSFPELHNDTRGTKKTGLALARDKFLALREKNYARRGKEREGKSKKSTFESSKLAPARTNESQGGNVPLPRSTRGAFRQDPSNTAH